MSGSILDLISAITPNIQTNGASNLVDDAQLPDTPRTPEKTNKVATVVIGNRKRKECSETVDPEPGYTTPPSSKRIRGMAGPVAASQNAPSSPAASESSSLTPHIRNLSFCPGSGAPVSSGLTPDIRRMAIGNVSRVSRQNNTSAPSTPEMPRVLRFAGSPGVNGAVGQPGNGMSSNVSAPSAPAPSAVPSQAPVAPRKRAQGTPVMRHPIPFVLPRSANQTATTIVTSTTSLPDPLLEDEDWIGARAVPRVIRQTTTADFATLMDTDGDSSSSPVGTPPPSDGSSSD